MKIVLPRTEVETAVKANLVKDGIVLEGKNVAMKFTANTVEVNITEASDKVAPVTDKPASK